MKAGSACFALVLAWAAVLAAPAFADGDRTAREGRFALDVKACPGVATGEVRRILGIEIGDLLIEDGEVAPAKSDRLSIRCADNFAWVEAAGQGGGPSIERFFRLDDFPGDAAPRALALAGLELLATRSSSVRARIASRQELSPPAASITAPSPARPEPVASTREVHLGLAGIWRTFLVGTGASAWGGELQVGSTLGRIWQLEADAEVAGARNDVGSGSEAMGQTSALLLSLAPTIGLRAGSGRLGASVALGGRLGVARLWGSSADPARIAGSTVWRPWGGPLAAASLCGRFGSLLATLRAEAGRSLIAAEGQAGGVTAITIRGWWLAVSLGAGLRL